MVPQQGAQKTLENTRVFAFFLFQKNIAHKNKNHKKKNNLFLNDLGKNN